MTWWSNNLAAQQGYSKNCSSTSHCEAVHKRRKQAEDENDDDDLTFSYLWHTGQVTQWNRACVTEIGKLEHRIAN